MKSKKKKRVKKIRYCARITCQNLASKAGVYCSLLCKNFALLKTVPQMKKAVWKLFSQNMKQEACKSGYFTCCSCGLKKEADLFNAGHYKHGDNVGTWINRKNVHPQCSSCNLFRSGNLDNYALFLERTYGPGILQELDKAYHSSPQTWTMEKLRDEYKKLYV